MTLVCVLLLAACAPVLALEVSGTVVSAVDRKPLKRAEVVLRPTASGATALGVTTDDQGRFAFFDLTSGRYALTVTRTDYLPAVAAHYNQMRLGSPFAVERSLTNLVVRLLPAAVIAGKVRHSDGEPASGLTVEAYREYFRRNKHGYEVAGRTSTNDRGEYRLFSLPPGRYYVAAVAVPFNGSDEIEEQATRDAYGRKVPPERAVTTFLPSSPKVTGATQLPLTAGETIENADIFITRSRTVTLRVRAIHGGTGTPMQGGAIGLVREDASGSAYLPSHAVVRPKADGEFEIRGVVPGAYALTARAVDKDRLAYTHDTLLVGDEPPDTLNVLAQPEVSLAGVVYPAERGAKSPPGLRITAEPRNEGLPTRSAQVERDGTFHLRLIPSITYDLLVSNTPRNVYLKSATLNGVDVLANGLSVPAATNIPVTLTVDERGAEIRGQAEPGAIVSLVPASQPLLRYSETQADEWGFFGFAAVAPGDYHLLTWFDEAPCDLWNPDRRNECSRHGRRITVDSASSHVISLEP